MDAGDDLLADVTALVVGDQTVEAEFRDDGCFVHIDTVKRNAALDPQHLIKLVCYNNAFIFAAQKRAKLVRKIIRNEITAAVRQFETISSGPTLADFGMIDILLGSQHLEVNISVGQILDKKISGKCEPK